MMQQQPGQDFSAESIPPPRNFRDILTIVFSQPRFLPVLTLCSWKKALLRVLIIGFCCGVLLGGLQAIRISGDVKSWSSWIAEELDAVWYEKGRLHWQPKAETPYQAYNRGWYVHFAEEGDSFSASDVSSAGNRGLWISSDAVYTWWRTPGGSAADNRSAVLYEDGKLFGMMSIPALIEPETTLRGNQLEQAVSRIFRQIIPVFLFFRGVAVDMQVLFYVLIFSVIPYFLRSPLAAGGFGSIFAFYLYLSLPALFVAVVYSAFKVPFLDFQTIFAVAFVVYLLVVLGAISKATRQKE